MKKTILVMSTIGLIACGGVGTPETFEGKVEAICDCFVEAKKDKDKRMDCFKLQDDYHKKIESKSKKQEFLMTTNSCSG